MVVRMHKEKRINRDIVYISDNSFLQEMKSLYNNSNKIYIFFNSLDNNIKKNKESF